MAAPGNRPYLSNGQVLQSPPLTARARSFIDSIYTFLGLYVVSLFSFDPYTAAQLSSFNIQNRRTGGSQRPRYGAGSGESGGKGPGGGGPGSGGRGPWSGGGGSGGGSRGTGKKMGTVDDVRGPECSSCG